MRDAINKCDSSHNRHLVLMWDEFLHDVLSKGLGTNQDWYLKICEEYIKNLREHYQDELATEYELKLMLRKMGV